MTSDSRRLAILTTREINELGLQKHLGGFMAHELGVAEIRSFLDTVLRLALNLF